MYSKRVYGRVPLEMAQKVTGHKTRDVSYETLLPTGAGGVPASAGKGTAADVDVRAGEGGKRGATG